MAIILRSHIERLSAVYADKYGQGVRKLFSWPSTWLRRIFIYVIPFILGAKGESFIQKIPTDESFTDLTKWLALFKEFWILIPLSLLWIWGFIWRNQREFRRSRLCSLRDDLNWMYSDLGFDSMQYANADIRCTIWSPVRLHHPVDNYRLMQILDYLPSISARPTLLRNPFFQKNKSAGRIYRFTKSDDGGNPVPIGIVGRCVLETIVHRTVEASLEKVILNTNETFEDYMVSNWNFTHAQANRLTQDRRSYLCIPITDRRVEVIYGIIYLDSCEPNTLTEEIGDRIVTKFLNPLARIFANYSEEKINE